MLGWRLFLDTNLAVIGAQAHANAAPDEIKELALTGSYGSGSARRRCR